MIITDKCLNILKDLNEHKRNKETLLENYVQERLNQSLSNYYKDLMESYNSVIYYDSIKVLKELERRNNKNATPSR